ncbi:hypothetical protein KY290_001036 [Solanum tuberosum]|uniref:DUF4283 domain-containing protein n=1 Tax=Solanum tuberosum TaxID=4113 RepID=A0ABQ7WMW8_SOLTU|nr:hypothetical protein KY290_001036 [Solanum tuberosum]
MESPELRTRFRTDSKGINNKLSTREDSPGQGASKDVMVANSNGDESLTRIFVEDAGAPVSQEFQTQHQNDQEMEIHHPTSKISSVDAFYESNKGIIIPEEQQRTNLDKEVQVTKLNDSHSDMRQLNDQKRNSNREQIEEAQSFSKFSFRCRTMKNKAGINKRKRSCPPPLFSKCVATKKSELVPEPGPFTVVQSYATRLRANQAKNEVPIELSIPKIITRQGLPAVIIKKEDYMVNLAARYRFTLVGKFTNTMPKIELIRKSFILQTQLTGGVKIAHFNARHIYIDLDNKEDHVSVWNKQKM